MKEKAENKNDSEFDFDIGNAEQHVGKGKFILYNIVIKINKSLPGHHISLYVQ